MARLFPHPLTKEHWGKLARELLDTPETVLARPYAAATLELTFACAFSGYAFGDLYMQVVGLLSRHADDVRTERRCRRLLVELRAILLDDSIRAAEPVIEAAKFLPLRNKDAALRRVRAL